VRDSGLGVSYEGGEERGGRLKGVWEGDDGGWGWRNGGGGGRWGGGRIKGER